MSSDCVKQGKVIYSFMSLNYERHKGIVWFQATIGLPMRLGRGKR